MQLNVTINFFTGELKWRPPGMLAEWMRMEWWKLPWKFKFVKWFSSWWTFRKLSIVSQLVWNPINWVEDFATNTQSNQKLGRNLKSLSYLLIYLWLYNQITEKLFQLVRGEKKITAFAKSINRSILSVTTLKTNSIFVALLQFTVHNIFAKSQINFN